MKETVSNRVVRMLDVFWMNLVSLDVSAMRALLETDKKMGLAVVSLQGADGSKARYSNAKRWFLIKVTITFAFSNKICDVFVF